MLIRLKVVVATEGTTLYFGDDKYTRTRKGAYPENHGYSMLKDWMDLETGLPKHDFAALLGSANAKQIFDEDGCYGGSGHCFKHFCNSNKSELREGLTYVFTKAKESGKLLVWSGFPMQGLKKYKNVGKEDYRYKRMKLLGTFRRLAVVRRVIKEVYGE